MSADVRRLGEVLEDVQSGFAYGGHEEDGIFQFRMNNVTTDGRIDLSKKRRVPRTQRLGKYSLRSGDVLFNATNSPDLVGKSAYFAGLDEPAVFSNHFIRLRPKGDLIDGRFLSRWLTYQFFRRVFRSMCRQWVNQATVSKEALLAMRLPLPSLDYQHRIADLLDQLDEVRVRRRRAIAELEILKQSIFLDMFGDHSRNPLGWPTARLGEVTECLDRLRKPVKESERPPGDVPYYGANGRQGWIDRPLFDEPLVLLAEDGGHFDEPHRGVAYKIEGPSWVNNHAHVLRARRDLITVDFLHRHLRHYDFTPYISGTTRSKLTQKQLNSALVMIPPLDLQQQFDGRVDRANALEVRMSEHLDRRNELFSTVRAEAFAGAP